MNGLDNKYTTEEHVVAFIDILGAKSIINKEENVSLNVVHNTYETTLETLEKIYEGELSEPLKPKIKIFSDNIVIAVPTKIRGKFAAFTSVAVYAGLIQNEFLHNHYLVRGGITVGDFFMDDVMLWGKALIEAYTIESSIAIYPRIVLDPKMVGVLGIANNKRKQIWLQQDNDRLFFINYMQARIMKSKENFLPLLIARLEECEKMLIDADGNLKVQQKILWHNTYLRNKLYELSDTSVDEQQT